MKNFRFLGVMVLIAALGSGCAAKKLASNITAKIFTNGSPVMEAQEDVEFARSSLISLIQMLEVMRADNPKNRDLNVLLAKSYGNYAYAFFEEELLRLDGAKECEAFKTAYRRADSFYTKGKDYGLSVLNQNKVVKKALSEGSAEKLARALARAYGDKEDAALLYWTAFNWGNWINLHKDSPLAVIALSKVEALMTQAEALDPGYFYGGIPQFFGAFYGSRPVMLGGNLEKSKAEFEKAVELTQGKFLLAKVAYAQYYAVAAQDRELFSRLLREVIASDPALLPEERMANEIALIRAKTLLENVDRYF